jgi:hypothetical protein
MPIEKKVYPFTSVNDVKQVYDKMSKALQTLCDKRDKLKADFKKYISNNDMTSIIWIGMIYVKGLERFISIGFLNGKLLFGIFTLIDSETPTSLFLTKHLNTKGQAEKYAE